MKEKPGEIKKTEEEILEEIKQAELAKLPRFKRPCFIEDGYTINGAVDTIVARDDLGRDVGVFEFGFEFTFRPLNAKEKKEWANVKDSENDAYMVKLLVDRISTWNLRDENGDLYTINESNIERLDSTLQNYIMALVLGLPEYENHANHSYTGLIGKKTKTKSRDRKKRN